MKKHWTKVPLAWAARTSRITMVKSSNDKDRKYLKTKIKCYVCDMKENQKK
jgi:hypothetical protein